jgi:hypothetical protein
MCRNPKCRSKLPAPVSNPREAFCTKGCHSSFYRHRCLICEREMERTQENQVICGRRKCRNALQGHQVNLGRFHRKTAKPAHDPQIVEQSLKTLGKSGIKCAHKDDPPWHIIAGLALTPDQPYAATVPDGPDCKWTGGKDQRIEAETVPPYAHTSASWQKTARFSRTMRQ